MKALWACALLLLAACDDMAVQPKQHGYSPAVAPVSPPAGTVQFEAGTLAAPRLTAALLTRGQERYRIYCVPCHAENGSGQGMIVKRGFPPPEPLFSERLRRISTPDIYEVISFGKGAMYPFAARIAPDDRWAIAAYVRALQHSQYLPAEQLPAVRTTAAVAELQGPP